MILPAAFLLLEELWQSINGHKRFFFLWPRPCYGAWAGCSSNGFPCLPLAVAGFRSAIALPVLLICFRKQTVNFSVAQLIGGVSYAATVILFVYATKLTTAGNAILLQYTAPVYVALFSGWLLNEKIRWFDWAAIAAVLCGMSLFFLDKLSSGGLTGNILAVISGFTFASLVLFMRKQKEASPVVPSSSATC